MPANFSRAPRPRSFYDRTIAPPLRLILALFVIGIVSAIGFGGYWLTSTSITIQVNGHATTVRTHQTTVDGVLREVSPGLTTSDLITPSRVTPLHGGLTITIQTAASVVVDADGQARQFLTRATDPQAILKAAGVTLGTGDQLIPIGNTDLTVIRARSIQIADGNHPVQQVQTTATTISGALAQAGITLYLADSVSPALDQPITAGLTITIVRSSPITVQVDGQMLQTRTRGATVGAALTGLGIALVGQDQVTPALDQVLVPNTAIRVIRVTESEESTQVAIPFTTIRQADTSVLPGQQRIVTPGTPGMAAIFVVVRREDGVAVSRSAPLRYIIQPPSPEVIAVSPADLPTQSAP